MTTSLASTKHTPRVEDDALVRGTGPLHGRPTPAQHRLYAAFVRSPHAHARVVSVRADEARKAKKVLAVLTAARHEGGECRDACRGIRRCWVAAAPR